MSSSNLNVPLGLPLSRYLSFENAGYNYKDAGSAPEDTPTAGAVSLDSRLGRSQTGMSDEVEIPIPRTDSGRYDNIALRVFSRPIEGAWRTGVPAPTEAPQQRANGSASKRKAPVITDRDVKYNWTRDTRPGDKPGKGGNEGIRWIHSNSHVLSCGEFEKLVTAHTGRGVDTGIKALTQRLLKRVWEHDEREFIGGKFLQPTAIRYDGQPKALDEEARPCTFFNFPYLSLDAHRQKNCTEGCGDCYRSGSKGHPKRTLLQCRYRLESTAAKDKLQSVTTIDPEIIAECLEPRKSLLPLSKSNPVLPIIHVPQIWLASLSGDVLITNGPLPIGDLQGKVVRTGPADTSQRPDGSGPALVRIILNDSGKVQRFLYPSDQCDWWFGLLSKQREISRRLSRPSKDSKSVGPNPALPPSAAAASPSSIADYKFYTSEDTTEGNSIGILNWLQHLKQSPSKERLDLWLKQEPTGLSGPAIVLTAAPDPPVNQLQKTTAGSTNSVLSSSVTTAIGSNVAASTSTTATGKSTGAKASRTGSQGSSHHQVLCATLLPFLQWPIIDDLGDEDSRDPVTRAKLKLSEVCQDVARRHSAVLQYHGDKKLFVATTPQRLPNSQPTRAAHEVLGKIHSQRDRLTKEHLIIAEEFVEHCRNLLECFTPSDVSPPPDPCLTSGDVAFQVSATQRPTELTSHHAVFLYWSLIGGIIEHCLQRASLFDEIPLLIKELRKIEKQAAELHVGTCTLRDLQPQHHSIDDSSVTARSKVLLEVILDALKAIFDIFAKFAALLEQQQGHQYQFQQQLAVVHDAPVRKACDLLKMAKDRLIAEADDIVHDKGLGRVVTPEAVVIMILDRLSRGVYECCTADVMDLYERIVETIALRVETDYSRGLLLTINRVQEELEIISKTLQEQKAAILLYRQSLDPKTYQPRSIRREMNFDHESKYIDKIVKKVQGRILDCGELIERTKSLAAQNVQLVETRQDENNNAIMVFTIVTVIFLPPSFLTSYFGMNLAGIANTDSRPLLFWEIGAPLTVVFVGICLGLIFYRPIKRRLEMRKEKMT